MTDERPENEMVSASYRELAGERAPAHLDQEILQLAASHAEHADYARSVNWTRPLAWAATIALCLAITLELTRVPAPEDIASPPEAKIFHDTDDAATGQSVAEQSAVATEESADVGPTEKLESASATADTFSDDREREASSRYRRAEDVAAPAAAAAPAATFELMGKDANMLRQAEEMARLQTGTNAEPRSKSTRCPEEYRAKPESWLTCIEALEEIGDHEAALIERESHVAVFPDFKLH
jgi:hypothetical protein